MVVVNLVAVLAGVVMFTHAVRCPGLLQDPRWSGWSVLQAGLCLVPAGLIDDGGGLAQRTLVAEGWGNRVSLVARLGRGRGVGYGVSALSVQRPLVLVGASAARRRRVSASPSRCCPAR